MSYYKIFSYYFEIKNRIFLVLLSWVLVILVSYIFKETLLYSFTRQSSLLIPVSDGVTYFIFTDVVEVFSIYVSLIFFLGNQCLILNSLYHVLIFFNPGLYKLEYNYLTFIFKVMILLFFFTVVLFNKILFSLSWNFFFSFQYLLKSESLNIHFEAKLSEYIDFYVSFYYSCVLYSQGFLLIVLFFNTFMGLQLKAFLSLRKFIYYFFVVISTLLTPPEVISQFLLGISFIFSYEVLVFYFILKSLFKSSFN